MQLPGQEVLHGVREPDEEPLLHKEILHDAVTRCDWIKKKY